MQNPQTSRPNKNTLFIAMSGHGKSQMLMQYDQAPKWGVRHLLFDPNEDHPWCIRFGTMREFARMARAACKRWYRDRRGFRIAYTGPQTPEIHEEWCKVVLSLLDGNHETYITDEELSGSCKTAGKAEFHHAIMMNQCRKYGGIYLGTSQKPTEVPKTALDQCRVWCFGEVPRSVAKNRFEEMGLEDWRPLVDLEPLNFYVRDRSRFGKQPKLVTLNYKDPDTIGRADSIHRIK